MWFKLATLELAAGKHLGSMESISKSYRINYSGLYGLNASHTSTKYENYGDSVAVTFTFTVGNGFKFASGSTITCEGTTIFTARQDYAAGSTFTATANISASVSVSGAASAVTPDVPTPDPGTTNYTFTLNPDPTSATVTLSATGYSTVSGTGSKSITVANGTKVNWSVSASGYTTRTGSWTISGGNKTENIVLTASSGGGGSALDLSTLSLAHCGSSKLGTGNKENLTYNQTTHELKVNNPGWYKVSYFTTPVQVGTEIEYTANYSTSNTGNFVGIYKQEDLVDGIAEANGSFWPAPSGFGVYAPGQGGNDFIYIWDKKNAKTKTADGLEGDYFNRKTIKLKLLATGTEVYVDGVKLTWALGATAATLTEGVNYYLGFHNNNSSGTSASTVASQTITYIGPIR